MAQQLDLSTLNGFEGMPAGRFMMPMANDERPEHGHRMPIDENHRFRKHLVRLMMFGLMTKQPVSFVGPAGCGKSREIPQFLERINQAYEFVSCHDGLEAADLFGYERVRGGPDGSGVDTVYIDGPVLRAMRTGIPLVLDERDSLAATVALSLNNVLDGLGYTIPETGEHITAQEGFCVIGTSNTNGGGDENGSYNTSNVHSRSTNSRWLVENVDYLTAAEEENLLKSLVPDDRIDEEAIECLVKFATATRESAAAGEMEHPMATRELVQTVQYSMLINSLANAIGPAYFNKLGSADRGIAESHWSLVFGTDEDGS
ncbi:MoxR family ATPase [Endozoicomonas sp. G2_2]|uniref:AAA family ATPase n=1 Tax=Endozoicomonas sp. G2_2 TaxID=2821092 RepID=UPI001AD9F5D9|nr:MoxR family ATPase [Endozoicomonas sp. G2_2]MBO9471111.1 MoxR family ATPase [Endozoicomonas sp. G2_2]